MHNANIRCIFTVSNNKNDTEMTTVELVKSRNGKEEPKMKRQFINGKMTWILQNPESLKWAVISEEQMEEINNLCHKAKYGTSIDDDPFILKA